MVIASPVYNWSLASTVKNLIELTGATGEGVRRSAWFDKLVTFVLTGGVPHSYMAAGPTSVGLMLDFKCIVNPYGVHAKERDWTEAKRPTQALVERLLKSLTVNLELPDCLRDRTYTSTWQL